MSPLNSSYIRLIGPQTWPATATSTIVGLIVASKGSLLLLLPSAILAAMLSMSSSVILNDICDREQDKFLVDFKPLASGQVGLREAKMFYAFILGLALAIAYAINVLYFALTVVGCFLSVLYSVRPIRLKERHMFSYVALAFGTTFLLPFAGYVAKKQALDIFIITPISLVLFPLVAFTLIGKDIIDYQNDCKAGVKTLPIRLGKKVAVKILSAGTLLSPLLVPFLVLVKLLPTSCMFVFISYPAIIYQAFFFLSSRYENLPYSLSLKSSAKGSSIIILYEMTLAISYVI